MDHQPFARGASIMFVGDIAQFEQARNKCENLFGTVGWKQNSVPGNVLMPGFEHREE